MTFFAVLNFAAGIAALLFACGELAEKRRWFSQPSNWIYASMVVGAVAVAGHGLRGGHHPTEVFFNTIVAMHFIRKMWQERGKRRLRPPQGVSAAEARDFLAKEKQDVEIKR